MANLEDLGEVISTDVLVVGGGIGGLCAAIKIKEESQNLDVLLVDKATVGWSGAAPKTGGVFWVIAPGEDDLDKFVEFHVKNIGIYLEDQELLYGMASESYGAVEQLVEWGVKIQKDAEGKLSTLHILDPRWSHTAADLDMLLPLRARARKTGAKIVNKVQVVELLKEDDRVVGAVGFNIIDGRFYIFKAKATILASGGCNYKAERMWSASGGEGIAMAYRAGAEMRNAEFHSLNDFALKDTGIPPRPYRGIDHLLNAAGESIAERYNLSELVLKDMPIAAFIAMDREVMEGRGPIYMDMAGPDARPIIRGGFEWNRPKVASMNRRLESKLEKYGPSSSPRPEVIASRAGTLSPIKVDHDMKTSLAGLWAIGDTSYMGSAWAGAISAPPGGVRGSGLMNALLAALRAGPSAVRFASEAAPPKVKDADVKKLKEDIFAPMRRDQGLPPPDAIYAIQDVVCPLEYSVRRSQDQLEEALLKLEEARQRLPELWAKDWHGLLKCHEVRSMAVCAEMTFRSALLRTESRGSHYREDYPKRDDRNWLKWVVVKQEDGKMAVSTEPIPIDKYKFKP
jgi:succinate dehydrogenase / fumarate reductase flavoprotein subunit